MYAVVCDVESTVCEPFIINGLMGVRTCDLNCYHILPFVYVAQGKMYHLAPALLYYTVHRHRELNANSADMVRL